MSVTRFQQWFRWKIEFPNIISVTMQFVLGVFCVRGMYLRRAWIVLAFRARIYVVTACKNIVVVAREQCIFASRAYWFVACADMYFRRARKTGIHPAKADRTPKK